MLRIILIVVPVFTVSMLAGIFGIYTYYHKLPSYSLKQIRISVTNHDWETFRGLVDVDSIIFAAADEILAERMEQDPGAYSMQQLIDAYEQEVKPEFVQTAQKSFEEYVSRGRIRFSDGRKLTDTERLLKQADVNAMQIVSISKPVISNGEGDVRLEFANSGLKTSFELTAHIVQQEDGSWKITGVTGFQGFSKAIRKALQAKLDKLNGPIRSKLADIVEVKDIRAEIGQGDEYGFSENLSMQMTADIHSDKPLAKITGIMHINAPDGGDASAPFELFVNSLTQGAQTFPVQKVLNPFVKSDVKIMRRGLRKSDIHAEITGITFQDGSRLELLKELPE